MPLSWNEIKDRALAFSKEWAHAESEDAEAKSFWDAFFDVFGVSRRRLASFERKVKKIDGKDGYIDLLWKGVVLIEHKSRGKDLDRAYKQATDYFPGLKERELPRYIVVSDFARFRVHDLETGETHEFTLKDLHKNVKRFAFLAGYQTHSYKEQDPVNIKAAEKMGRLYDRLKATGYDGHPLQVYLVRVLFCLFADDTGIFERALFYDWLRERTAEDGSDLASKLAELFQVLNTPADKRLKSLDEQVAQFPYINGKLFQESLPIAGFDAAMREALLECCALDWSSISPAIFGALFQSIMDDKARRNLGAHYTSEKNILKLIHPLFLDELRAEFERVKTHRNKLFEFHKKLRSLTFLDPACGCGNFLVITYRELRLLELDVLRAARTSGQLNLDVHSLIHMDVDQFYGIEIEEFPAQIAQVALWLMDHQMNLKVSEEFGLYFARIPLKTSASIVHGNALTLDWNTVVPHETLSYILGNPPFIGHQNRSDAQIADMTNVWGSDGRFGRLDFVTCWHRRAVEFMKLNDRVKCALVSTNSICQGEQVGILWAWMLEQGVSIHFTHRTFQWNNEARGNAAVHCVIVGFALRAASSFVIYDYGEDLRGLPTVVKAKRINPYLVDAPDVILPSRTRTRNDLPQLIKGSQPTDGGNLLLSSVEKAELLSAEPEAAPWIKRFMGGEELLHRIERWCLWLKEISPTELAKLPLVRKRVEAVATARLQSATESVRAFASMPTIFTQDRQPNTSYLALSRHSSENRRFIPIAFLSPDVIAGDALVICPGATLFHFGVMCSSMHNSWVRNTCGRLKSDFRYEASVYNNFPWPLDASDKQKAVIEDSAQGVLDARKQFPDASLADLYDPLTMPPALLKAHQTLDRAVDAAYGKTKFASDAERVAFLFEQYQKLTSLLPAEKPKKRKGRV